MLKFLTLKFQYLYMVILIYWWIAVYMIFITQHLHASFTRLFMDSCLTL